MTDGEAARALFAIWHLTAMRAWMPSWMLAAHDLTPLKEHA